MLPFFLQKTPIAMRYAPFLCSWKSEKTENARLFRYWDREQAGRHVEKWGGGGGEMNSKTPTLCNKKSGTRNKSSKRPFQNAENAEK